MRKRRFKDKLRNDAYYALLGKSPKEMVNSRLGVAFRYGYAGKPKPKWVPLNTQAYAAYVAGKETKKVKS